MSHQRTFSHRRRHLLLVAFAALAIAGGGAGAAAQASDPPPSGSDGGSMDSLLRALDLKPKATTAPAFVRASRPDAARDDFIPVGRAHPERPVKAMTPAEVQAETAALDGDRVAQQRRAGIKPPAVPLKKAKRDEAASPPASLR